MTICPDCKAENIPGTDFCEECGHDLRNLDLPQAEDTVMSHLLNDRLGDLGAEQPLIVSPGDPVALAIHVMQQHQRGCALVTEEGRLVGVLTERDVLLKAAGEKVDLNAIAVRDIMTPDPVILREEDTLAVALHKMAVGGFRHVPLVRANRPIRIVDVQDVLRHISAFIQGQPAATS